MRREPGWDDTLLVAKPADPPDSGIRNPHSSQRCLLVPSKPASPVSGNACFHGDETPSVRVPTRGVRHARSHWSNSLLPLSDSEDPSGYLGPRPIDG